MKKTILSLLLTINYCSAATISVSGGGVFDVRGSDASLKPDVGDLFIVVASKSNDIFENLLAGDDLSVGSTVGGADDVVIATGSLVDFSGNRAQQSGFTNLLISDAAEPNPALSAGDHFAFIWFDGVSSTGAVAVNSVYGIVRASDWVLPSSGTTSASDVTATQIAGLTVNPVPEPSSVALLGLGSLALLARRRKN